MPNDAFGFFVKARDGLIAGFEESNKGAWTGRMKSRECQEDQPVGPAKKRYQDQNSRTNSCLAPAQAARLHAGDLAKLHPNRLCAMTIVFQHS